MKKTLLIIEVEKNMDTIPDIIKFVSKKKECYFIKIEVPIMKKNKRILVLPGLYIDLDQYIVKRQNTEIIMSSYEFHLLSFLAKQPGRVFTKEQIYEEIYSNEKIVNIDNAVYCLIRSVRKKLKNDLDNYNYIQTVRGVGYKLIIPKE